MTNKTYPWRIGAAVVGCALLLNGCVAVAVATVVAMPVLTTFSLYKTVQMSTGGRVKIAFGSTDGKKVAQAQPLPIGRTAAVWPGTEREARLAERLKVSGRYEVTTPSVVARDLAAAGTPVNMLQLTSEEQTTAFQAVCSRHSADLVFAAWDYGVSTNAKVFSLKRGGATQTSDLVVFSCAEAKVVWKDRMAVTTETGSKTFAAGEVAAIAGEAWAERVLQSPATKAVLNVPGQGLRLALNR